MPAHPCGAKPPFVLFVLYVLFVVFVVYVLFVLFVVFVVYVLFVLFVVFVVFVLFSRRKTQKNGIGLNGRRIEKRAVERYALEKRSGVAFRANLSAGTEPERNVTRGAAAVRMTAARTLAHAHPPPEKKARIPSRHAATGVSPQFPCPLTSLLRSRLRHHPDEKRFCL